MCVGDFGEEGVEVSDPTGEVDLWEEGGDPSGDDGGVEQEDGGGDSSSESNFQVGVMVILVGLFMTGLDAKSISPTNCSSFNPDMHLFFMSNTVPMK